MNVRGVLFMNRVAAAGTVVHYSMTPAVDRALCGARLLPWVERTHGPSRPERTCRRCIRIAERRTT
jgi:hypothetical protein